VIYIIYYIPTCVSACKSRRRQTASTRCLSCAYAWHIQYIYIYLCVYTLYYSRLILYGSNFRSDFFFCLVRLVQTFRSRNNHNNNNNNTNAGPSGRNFIFIIIIIIIYIDGPRAVDHYCTWRNRLCTRGRTVSFFLAFLPFFALALYIPYIYK
jgi:hypothetical protein